MRVLHGGEVFARRLRVAGQIVKFAEHDVRSGVIGDKLQYCVQRAGRRVAIAFRVQTLGLRIFTGYLRGIGTAREQGRAEQPAETDDTLGSMYPARIFCLRMHLL